METKKFKKKAHSKPHGAKNYKTTNTHNHTMHYLKKSLHSSTLHNHTVHYLKKSLHNTISIKLYTCYKRKHTAAATTSKRWFRIYTKPSNMLQHHMPTHTFKTSFRGIITLRLNIYLPTSNYLCIIWIYL